MSKQLTIKELIDQKEKIAKNKMKQEALYIPSLDSEVTVQAPTTALILEAQDMGSDDPTRADVYLVYQCMVVPDLKDKELQKAYDCTEPMDIVDEIFLPGEVASIAEKIMGIAGFGGVKLKN